MPAPKGPSYPAEWFKKAEEDIRRVKRRLQEEDTEDAAFHLQQAIEKALKGFLLQRGWPLKKIHDLEALLDDAVRQDATLEQFRALVQQVTGYYLVERYPGFEEGPSEKELTTAYQKAKALLTKLRP